MREGNCFEAGTWRIPYSHREFALPLIPRRNLNLNTYAYVNGSPE